MKIKNMAEMTQAKQQDFMDKHMDTYSGIFIIDDPISKEATTKEKTNKWFNDAFASRLNDKSNKRTVMILSRVHE